jgi:4a-hydroxytetrahydrobiopterin dehydratase
MTDLAQKKCVPCEGGVPAFGKSEVENYLSQLKGWSRNGKWITKEFSFTDFVAAMKFVNKVADIAEAESHHPDIHIHYNRVRLEIWTHAIDGLSENDFILAAKVDGLD